MIQTQIYEFSWKQECYNRYIRHIQVLNMSYIRPISLCIFDLWRMTIGRYVVCIIAWHQYCYPFYFAMWKNVSKVIWNFGGVSHAIKTTHICIWNFSALLGWLSLGLWGNSFNCKPYLVTWLVTLFSSQYYMIHVLFTRYMILIHRCLGTEHHRQLDQISSWPSPIFQVKFS